MNNHLALLILLSGLFGCAPGALATTTYCEGNEEILQTYLEMTDILFNKRESHRASEYYADSFVSHNADEGGANTTTHTPAHMEAMWENSKRSMPDRILTNDVVICKDNLVIARVTMKGTMGQGPATGKPFDFTAIDIYRFEDGKVVERWGNNDGVTMLRQLGLMPDVPGLGG